MILKSPLILTRRNFSIAALSVSLSCLIKMPAIANERTEEQADALMQKMPNGNVIIYSGGGHMGPYGDSTLQHILSEELEIKQSNISFDLSGNPEHLPGFLGQCCHHMSFTNRVTNLKAASILRHAVADFDAGDVKYIIEDGVCEKTREMALTLKPVGIVVAARSLI